ncbi:membrane-binding protein [Flavobacterium sp.]|uniref:toxin-antitoxin system YwqK family antitoxin n=1 Tax=Flavobacterium sp. TaxID=239 RepID=UPI00286EAF91|nr:membrane-binding protein [Flavobacterium sp.]
MKKYIILSLLLLSGVLFAQSIEPKYEIEGNLVKATYFHDNGNVKQEGFYKDGKVHGKWISYSEVGNKISLGEFNKGEKTGKWFFWNEKSLSEVDYTDSRVAEVKKWSQETLAQRN